jgi:hypothetical protein
MGVRTTIENRNAGRSRQHWEQDLQGAFRF